LTIFAKVEGYVRWSHHNYIDKSGCSITHAQP